jgi:peptidoglycan lytic transglycosylase
MATSSIPKGGLVMRTLLMVLGLCGLLLTPLPDVAHGGPAKTKHAKATQVKTKQVGLASWYGKPHQGRKTASGERFSRQHLTAAHRSLPLGTKVKVTNLRTKRQVVVKINDRGPYGGSQRIIDLSEAAAKQIGLLEQGTERVEVAVVERAS